MKRNDDIRLVKDSSPQPELQPALTADEWRGVLSNSDKLGEVKAGFSQGPFTAHALSAILLYAESYGFTQQDVTDETDVAAYCAKMATDHASLGDDATAETFRKLGERHRERAAKIAALLPPDQLVASS